MDAEIDTSRGRPYREVTPGRKAMIRRSVARLTLVCYSAIALCGQGLHSLIEEHGHAHLERNAFAIPAGIESPSDDCHHDSDTCAICQHHSLGQILVAPVPVESGLEVCEAIVPRAPQFVVCQAHFSPAQPRAPPIA